MFVCYGILTTVTFILLFKTLNSQAVTSKYIKKNFQVQSSRSQNEWEVLILFSEDPKEGGSTLKDWQIITI